MEINLSSLLDANMFQFAHSCAEGGERAGGNTWSAAIRHAGSTRPPLLPDEEACQAFRDWLKDFGAWDEEERAAMGPTECNALLLQFIAGDVREAGADNLDSIDWEEYEKDSQEGRISGNLFRSDDGAIFFSMSH